MNNDFDFQSEFRKETTTEKPKKSIIPNNALYGLIIGIIFPILGIIVLYLYFGDGNPKLYFRQFTDWDSRSAMERSSKVVSLSMIANLIPFYFFLNKKKYLTTRGILIATMLCAVLIFLYKFVWQ